MPRTLQGIVSVVGRVLLCTIFFMAAVGNKIPNFQAVAGYMAKEGVPAPQSCSPGRSPPDRRQPVGHPGLQGPHRGGPAAGLPGPGHLLFPRLLDAQRPPGQAGAEIQFMKNLGLMGAMLLVIANGTGPMSLDGRGRRVGEEALTTVVEFPLGGTNAAPATP